VSRTQKRSPGEGRRGPPAFISPLSRGKAAKVLPGRLEKKTECPLIFDPEKADDNAYLTQIEEGHVRHAFSCEARLASDAVRKMKTTKGSEGSGE